MAVPRLSIVVPTTADRSAVLRRCLAAIGRSAMPPGELEVVVIGDGEDVPAPPPGSAGAVAVRFAAQPHAGPAAARNHGARLAGASVLAFTDDDCVPLPGWAPRLLAAVEARPEALVGGHVRNGLPGNPWAEASHAVLEAFTDTYNARRGAPGFAPTCSIAMRRDVHARLGGLDERFRTAAAEDRDLCHRAALAGHPTVVERRAEVEHLHALDLRSFLRQSMNYGRGEVTYRRMAAEDGREPDVMTDRFYRVLVLRALRRGPRRGLPLLGRIVASQAAFRLAFAVALRRPRRA